MKKTQYKYDVRGEKGDDLRARCEKAMGELPLGIKDVANQMGLSYETLASFLDGSKSTFRKSLWAIRSWVEEKEKDRDVE